MYIRKDVQAVIYDDSDNALNLLLVLKQDFIEKSRYDWRLLKGGVKDGEDYGAAMRREIREEVGLSRTKVEDKVYSYEFIQPRKNVPHCVTVYSVKADRCEPVKPDAVEIKDCVWVPYKNARNKLRWPDEKKSVREWKKLYDKKLRPTKPLK